VTSAGKHFCAEREAPRIVATTAGAPLRYPPARRSEQVDLYHGTEIADPYRWLEDVDAPETRAWIEAESALTESVLAAIPERDAIRLRLTEIWDYERFGVPGRVGERYVVLKNSGLQNQSVVYIADRLDGPARVLLDPNTFSADGTVALGGLAFSDDGRLAAYATTASGSDWLTWRVRDVETGADLPDELRWSKFSTASWLPDGSGFYYCRYAAPGEATQFKDENYFHQVYFHRIGTAQTDDALVYERPDHKDWNFGPEVSEDGRWLVLHVSQGADPNNRVFVQELRDGGAPVIEMLPDADAAYGFIGNDDDRFYFRTTKDAPRGRVVALTLGDPTLVEIVPQTPDALESVTLFGDRLVLGYLRDAHAVVCRRDLHGAAPVDVALPGLGSVGGLGGKRRERETFFSFTSYTVPASIYRLDVESGATSPVFAPTVRFNPERFISEQVFFASRDGTRIPMFVTRLRSAARPRDPDDSLRLRRLRDLDDAGVLAGGARLARARRPVRRREHTRRWRVWRSVAPRRNETGEAKRLRRLHRRGRVPHRERLHVDAETCDLRRQQRRAFGRGVHGAAARALRRRHPDGRGPGHAALSEVHDRVGLDVGLRELG